VLDRVIGDPAQHPLGAEDLGHGLGVADTVLHGEHVGIVPDDRQGRLHGDFGLVGLDRDVHQIHRSHAVHGGHCPDRHITFALGPFGDEQAVLVQQTNSRLVDLDHHHIFTGFTQMGADETTQSAGTNNNNFHSLDSLSRNSAATGQRFFHSGRRFS